MTAIPTPTSRRSNSLLNYETVKYFVAEEREAGRYDRVDGALRRRQRARPILRSPCSMPGQAVIFTVGLAAAMVMCAFEIQAGTKTVGDFVLINAMMIQLYQPLNFMGMVYREIKQAMTDIETHVRDSGARSGDQGRGRRAAAEGDQRRHPLRECQLCL